MTTRTVKDEIDLIQSHLHDDGTLWPRAELLRWYNDGYVRMLADSQAVRRFFIVDIPGRVTWSFAYEWEDRHCPGLHRRFARPYPTHNTSYTWEVEQLGGLETVNAGGDCPTQLWELAYSGTTDQHFRFALNRQHDRIIRVQWDDESLVGTSVKELDQGQFKWWQEDGEPIAWFSGVGRDQSVELFSIETDYNQQYETTSVQGLARNFVGDRTYTASSASPQPYGIARRILSADRQYAPQAYADGLFQFAGIPRDYQSTTASLGVVQVIVPTRQLKEEEAASLVPNGLRKYLRFFVLSRALGRKGEGQQHTIAQHYEKRFERGVNFFKKLSNLSFADRTYSRQEYDGNPYRRLPRPHLPSEFERQW